jgi:beta-glucanase (GH16 family)
LKKIASLILILLAVTSCSNSKNSTHPIIYFVENVDVDYRSAAKKNNLTKNDFATINTTSEISSRGRGAAFDVRITADETILLHEDQSPNTDWKLFWSDEFNYQGLPDSTKWTYDIGGNGWGNNELQYYTAKEPLNAIVENGSLKIIARKQLIENRPYTSARLVTKNIVEFKYGKIDIRAKLPKGMGTWPAVWMLGKNISEVHWPTSGEIDIMEHVGYMKDSIFGTIHSAAYNGMKGTQKTKGIFISNPYDQFHDYGIEWTPERIDFFMDGVLYNHITNEHLSVKEWPFDQPFFLLVNLAIGGNWGGKFGVDENIFPAIFELDYIRVYKANE